MTARDLIAKWGRSDVLYREDPRAADRARAMEDEIRIHRYAEANALPPDERRKALDELAKWRPPVMPES